MLFSTACANVYVSFTQPWVTISSRLQQNFCKILKPLQPQACSLPIDGLGTLFITALDPVVVKKIVLKFLFLKLCCGTGAGGAKIRQYFLWYYCYITVLRGNWLELELVQSRGQNKGQRWSRSRPEPQHCLIE